MTQEQKEQLAREYLKEVVENEGYWSGVYYGQDIMQAYIDALDSRDEEFALLRAEIEDDNAVMKQLKAELKKAQNPWRDGNEKPQDICCDYLLDYGDLYRAAMYDSGMWMSYDLHPLKQPIRWMPIPKGGDV